ncbi:hypothetical protein EXIGLDRAFT_319460 [Exidia glandulosa HHB12029]|uniref:Uncharacterized protein n=1 Tax=Exidia glandulosa HHB12029 TaxID=1314781 RepID=A0A165Q494_EXIGL|nr:hypothetical protein EXIGLDRAFT_319460 [Exidia glandulosa HHB12029]
MSTQQLEPVFWLALCARTSANERRRGLPLSGCSNIRRSEAWTATLQARIAGLQYARRWLTTSTAQVASCTLRERAQLFHVIERAKSVKTGVESLSADRAPESSVWRRRDPPATAQELQCSQI